MTGDLDPIKCIPNDLKKRSTPIEDLVYDLTDADAGVIDAVCVTLIRHADPSLKANPMTLQGYVDAFLRIDLHLFGSLLP